MLKIIPENAILAIFILLPTGLLLFGVWFVCVAVSRPQCV